MIDKQQRFEYYESLKEIESRLYRLRLEQLNQFFPDEDDYALSRLNKVVDYYTQLAIINTER